MAIQNGTAINRFVRSTKPSRAVIGLNISIESLMFRVQVHRQRFSAVNYFLGCRCHINYNSYNTFEFYVTRIQKMATENGYIGGKDASIDVVVNSYTLKKRKGRSFVWRFNKYGFSSKTSRAIAIAVATTSIVNGSHRFNSQYRKHFYCARVWHVFRQHHNHNPSRATDYWVRLARI